MLNKKEIPQNIMLFIFSLGLVCLSGLVASNLWNWFISPLGVMNINWIQGMGIDLLITFLVYRVIQEDMEDQDLNYKMKRFSIALASTLVIWGHGYVIHLFM